MRHRLNLLGARASTGSSMLIIGATFYPNWLTTMSPVSRRMWCCRRRRVTRESGYDRGGNTLRRSGTRRETVRGYGWGLISLCRMRL
ncbi:hypothetical protein LINPERPRIM_LOCUS26924 [Linum perenne]